MNWTVFLSIIGSCGVFRISDGLVVHVFDLRVISKLSTQCCYMGSIVIHNLNSKLVLLTYGDTH